MKSKVAVVGVEGGLEEALVRLFRPFGGIPAVLAGRSRVFIKVNAIDFKPYCYTDPEVVRALVGLFRDAGARRVLVMDNCTQGNFTRLVFRVTGLARAVREAGGEPLYLDEGKQERVMLPTLGYQVRVSRWVKRYLMDEREENLYLSLPKLKTHSMATVTLGVKNQMGLLAHEDRMRDHNWKLHRKLADIYALIRPDFTVIEGLHAVNHGHYPPQGLADRCVEELGVLIGGDDTLAVDAVGADLLGIDPLRVEHLRLAAEGGWGTIDLGEIEVVGEREPFRRRFTPELLPDLPPGVRLIKGRERCCREGCLLNTIMVLQTLHVDFGADGDFSVCMGKGLDPGELEGLGGRVLLVGDCAVEEAGEALTARLGKKMVREAPGCNNLRDVLAALASFMRVDPVGMVPVPPWQSAWLLLQARLHRTTARIPPLVAR